jgi:hypothetical protein
LAAPLRISKVQILAYFDRHGVSNGGTEAINLIIEKVRRHTHGFNGFDHYDSESCSPQTDHAATGTTRTPLNPKSQIWVSFNLFTAAQRGGGLRKGRMLMSVTSAVRGRDKALSTTAATPFGCSRY